MKQELKQSLKDLEDGFNSLIIKLQKIIEAQDKRSITIRTPLTRGEAGRAMALLLKDFYVHKQIDRIIGLRLDGAPCCIVPNNPNVVVIAEFYDTQESDLLKGYQLNALQDPDFWNDKFLKELGADLIFYYDGKIRIEYEGF